LHWIGDTRQSATIAIAVTPTTAGPLSNSATVTSSTSDPVAANNSASQGTTVNALADVSIVKTDAVDPVPAGNDLTYTLTVSNAGPSTAVSVTVTDPLPPTVDFLSASATQGTCEELAGLVACDVGDLEAGAGTTIEIEVRPDTAEDISNTATVASSTTDPDPTNDSDSERTSVVDAPLPSADVSVTKTHEGRLVPGETTTYRIAISNDGPDDAVGPVVVTDELPDALTFVSASGDGWKCSSAGQIVTCSHKDDLKVGQTSSISVKVLVAGDGAGEIVNQASVSSKTPDPSSPNNDASDAGSVHGSGGASPAPTKTTPPSSPSEGSGELAFTGFNFQKAAAVALALLLIGCLLIALPLFRRRRPSPGK
jgi:uncharacterized repeat protein (TIGR01451 family)